MNIHTNISHFFSSLDGIGAIDLHVILLSVLKFPEIRLNEDHTFLVDLYSITLKRVA